VSTATTGVSVVDVRGPRFGAWITTGVLAAQARSSRSAPSPGPADTPTGSSTPPWWRRAWHRRRNGNPRHR
jgi:hypothetical protein